MNLIMSGIALIIINAFVALISILTWWTVLGIVCGVIVIYEGINSLREY